MKAPHYPNPAGAAERAMKKVEMEKKIAAKNTQAVTLAVLMDVMEFRSIVNHWLEACGLDDPITGLKQSNDMQQALGKRCIGLLIKKELEEAAPELYDVMVKEARAEKFRRTKDGK